MASFPWRHHTAARRGTVLSLAIYDSLLPGHFFSSRIAQRAVDPGRINAYRYVTGTLGALLSPGRGLFIYSPLLLWALYEPIREWRHLSSRAWAAVALAVIGGHLWLLVHTGVWAGRMAFGPRLFSDVLVWFFLLATLGLEALRARWESLGAAARWTQAAVLAVLLSFSVFVNVRGAYSTATWTWSSYDRPPRWLRKGQEPLLPQPEMWNWRYPQFMAGLLPPDGGEPPPRREMPAAK